MKYIGTTLLAIWLIVTGLSKVINLSFNGKAEIMAALAILAGIFLLIRR